MDLHDTMQKMELLVHCRGFLMLYNALERLRNGLHESWKFFVVVVVNLFN